MADTYAWAGGREAVLRLGPEPGDDGGPLVLVAPALFEEANRTRAFTIAIMRGLAMRGVASALPDLPGTNDSLVPTEQARLSDWRAAYAACVGGRRTLGFAIRGGALVDAEADLFARCHFEPVGGASLIRDMKRARLVSGDRGESPSPEDPVELAGNRLSVELVSELENARPSKANRLFCLRTSSLACNRMFEGRALWRASEPDVDQELADELVESLTRWVHRCGG